MKITKSELKEIIKEEAIRFISIQKLKKEKEKINYELNKITEIE
jgi:transposase